VASEASLQVQAKALGDPTRHSIFRYLADSNGPVDVAELTSHFGLNHNAIRQHLAKLVEAGLVVEDTGPREGPGRPKLIYRVDSTADGRWSGEGPYQRLSLLLIEMIASGSTPEEAGRRAGRELKVATPPPGEDPISAMQDAIARGGFDPMVRHRGDTIEYVLSNCPFAEAAVADPDTICGLHLGLAQGLADQLEGVTVDDLVRRNPHRAGCRLRFHVDTPDIQSDTT
jgi:predicted ArsR family transcriptional regulator